MYTAKTSQQQRRDVYEEVTAYVIAALEKGKIIWKQPWNKYGLPQNVCTRNQYRGYNVFFLNFVCRFKNYKAPYFLTFLQAQQMGGHIKKGERGYQIVYWKLKEDKYRFDTVVDAETGNETRVPKQRLVPMVHTVFNLDQTEGIPFPATDHIERTNIQKLEACEEVVANMPDRPAIIHGGDRACYSPSQDQVRMPAQAQFHSDEEYYTTLFHELAHSTGHPRRLNREELRQLSSFGDHAYSKEELTAELTAAYLSAITGIEQKTIDNSAAYLQGWLHALKNDKRLFLKATTQAQVAADYILNVSNSNEKATQESRQMECVTH